MLIGIVVALVALGGIVAAGAYVRRSGEWGPGRTTLLTALLGAAVLVAAVGMNLVQLLYRPSALLVAGLGIAFLAVGGLFVALAYSLRRRPLAVLALIGFVVAVNLLFVVVAIAVVPSGQWVQDMYALRTARIAESQGFTGLLRADATLSTDSLPVEEIAQPDPGIWISYRDCMLQERKLAAPRSEAELRKLIAQGAKPLGPDGPPMPADADVTTLTVAGAPALGVTFLSMPPSTASDAPPPVREKTMLLLAQVRGVDVRLASQDVLKQQEGSGSWAPQTGLAVEDLARIAEKLRPVEPRR